MKKKKNKVKGIKNQSRKRERMKETVSKWKKKIGYINERKKERKKEIKKGVSKEKKYNA